MEEEQVAPARPIAWLIADTETVSLTGPACEIALREICPDTLETLDEVQSLIDPECEIEPKAQEIHGISQEMVADAPTLQEFIEHPLYLANRYKDRDIVLICHNASFDVKRLNKIGNVISTVCTLFHARQLIPKGERLNGEGEPLANHQLGTLREYFGFKNRGGHRAMVDVDTTHQLLVELMTRHTTRTLIDFYNTAETTIHRQPWGKHAGTLLLDLPESYVQWLWNLPDLETNLKKSLEKVMKTRNISKKLPK